MHFLTVSALMEDEEKWHQISEILSISNGHTARASLLYALQFVLQFLNSSFDESRYEQLLKAQQSIPYLLEQVHQWLVTVVRTESVGADLPSQRELSHIFMNLNQQWKCLKLKMLAVKHIGSAQRNYAARGWVNRQIFKSRKSAKSGIFGKLFGGMFCSGLIRKSLRLSIDEVDLLRILENAESL